MHPATIMSLLYAGQIALSSVFQRWQQRDANRLHLVPALISKQSSLHVTCCCADIP